MKTLHCVFSSTISVKVVSSQCLPALVPYRSGTEPESIQHWAGIDPVSTQDWFSIDPSSSDAGNFFLIWNIVYALSSWWFYLTNVWLQLVYFLADTYQRSVWSRLPYIWSPGFARYVLIQILAGPWVGCSCSSHSCHVLVVHHFQQLSTWWLFETVWLTQSFINSSQTDGLIN